MFKRLLLVVAAVAGALVVRKSMEDAKAERELWSEATDDVRETGRY